MSRRVAGMRGLLSLGVSMALAGCATVNLNTPEPLQVAQATALVVCGALASSPSGPESVSDYQALRSRRDRQVCVESLKNPTPAMLQQMEKMKSRPTSEVVADVDGGKKEG